MTFFSMTTASVSLYLKKQNKKTTLVEVFCMLAVKFPTTYPRDNKPKVRSA